MIKRKEEMRLRVRDEIRGGKGTVEDLNILEPAEMLGKCTLCTKLFLDPGDSIGEHAHADDAEIYYVLEGELVVREDGEEVVLREGDVAFTANGSSHSVENRSTERAVMLAIIFP